MIRKGWPEPSGDTSADQCLVEAVTGSFPRINQGRA